MDEEGETISNFKTQEAINLVTANNIIYSISTWALIDEATLSSNVVSQFECVLLIEGTNYEQRQSLALQRGKLITN